MSRGFLAPVDRNAVNVIKGGSTVPIKWQLAGQGGGYIGALGAVSRTMEAQADRFGLQITGNGHAAARAFVKLSEDNLSLQHIQQMPMNQRRHTIFVLLGNSFGTLSAIQAFQQSVHAVVNRDELALLGPNILGPIVQRVVAGNDLFLNVYRDTQLRILQGKV